MRKVWAYITMIAAALAIIQVQTVSVSADSMANPLAANSHVLPKNDIVLTNQTTTQQPRLQ